MRPSYLFLFLLTGCVYASKTCVKETITVQSPAGVRVNYPMIEASVTVEQDW